MKIIEEHSKWGLTVNIDKIKYICIESQNENLELENNQEISECRKYVYLDFTFDTTDAKKIKKHVIKAKKVIGCLNGILWSKEITKNINITSIIPW